MASAYLIWLTVSPILRYAVSFLVVEAAKHTTYPRWGRLLPYHDVVLRIDPIKIALNSLVLLLSPPEAYAVPSIAAENPTAQFAGIYDSREIRDKINCHKTESPQMSAPFCFGC